MNKVLEKREITLIVLVITIIILLILAGVAIATLTGENGLFARAKQAKENYSVRMIFSENHPVRIVSWNESVK